MTPRLAETTVEEVISLARSEPRSGRAAAAKLGAGGIRQPGTRWEQLDEIDPIEHRERWFRKIG